MLEVETANPGKEAYLRCRRAIDALAPRATSLEADVTTWPASRREAADTVRRLLADTTFAGGCLAALEEALHGEAPGRASVAQRLLHHGRTRDLTDDMIWRLEQHHRPDETAAVLRAMTEQDFGTDAARWRAWLEAAENLPDP